MKDQQNSDQRAPRKSGRQRVPNQFYVEGISQLKKTPKVVKESTNITKNKNKNKLFQEEDQSFNEDNIKEEEINQYQKLAEPNWYNCKLPNQNNFVKVQFILQGNQEPEKKKEEKVVKPFNLPKTTSASNLLSIFQKVIQDVNDDPQLKPSVAATDLMANIQSQQVKYQRAPITPPPKKVRVQDVHEGKMTEVRLQNGVLKIKHTKLNDVNILMEWTPKRKDTMEDENEKIAIEEYKQKLSELKLLNSISIFN